MGKAVYKVEGGKMIRVQLTERGGRIQEVRITGDFFLHPEELIEDLETALVGQPLRESDLADSIRRLVEERGATLLGASPRDFARCVLMAGGRVG